MFICLLTSWKLFMHLQKVFVEYTNFKKAVSILYSENCNGSTKNIFNFIMYDLFNRELRQLFLA